jgi:hypothetical protein
MEINELGLWSSFMCQVLPATNMSSNASRLSRNHKHSVPTFTQYTITHHHGRNTLVKYSDKFIHLILFHLEPLTNSTIPRAQFRINRPNYQRPQFMGYHNTFLAVMGITWSELLNGYKFDFMDTGRKESRAFLVLALNYFGAAVRATSTLGRGPRFILYCKMLSDWDWKLD